MDLRAGTAVLLLVLLCGGSEALQNITVEPGQNVTLTCEAPQNLTVLVAEWRRTNLGEKYLFVFRQNHLVEGVHQQFRNRVFLPEGDRGRGGVSVVVRNVTPEDSGKYLCQIKQTRTTDGTIIPPGRMISSICLSVVPPGDEVRKEDEEGSRTRLTQLIVVVGVVGVVVGVLIVYLIVKCQNTNNNPPDHGNHQQTSGEGIPLNGVSSANRSSGA